MGGVARLGYLGFEVSKPDDFASFATRVIGLEAGPRAADGALTLRMDDHAQSWGWAMPKLPLTPSEYFARQCAISCDPGERTLGSVVSLCGEEAVVFATDYPHPDAVSGDLVAQIEGRAGLGERAKRAILVDNARRAFGFAA